MMFAYTVKSEDPALKQTKSQIERKRRDVKRDNVSITITTSCVHAIWTKWFPVLRAFPPIRLLRTAWPFANNPDDFEESLFMDGEKYPVHWYREDVPERSYDKQWRCVVCLLLRLYALKRSWLIYLALNVWMCLLIKDVSKCFY